MIMNRIDEGLNTRDATIHKHNAKRQGMTRYGTEVFDWSVKTSCKEKRYACMISARGNHFTRSVR